MREKIKTVIAFSVLAIVVIVALFFAFIDKTVESASYVYPTENTKIRIYGEAHGKKRFYDLELKLWEERYEAGDRALFVELPYYAAEFLNLWMHEDSDELLDQFYEEIQGTQSGNEYYYAFLKTIKEECPETVFYGTDVGHQYETMGARYLTYLEDHGLKDSENYKLAEECIRQGKVYYETREDNSGKSPVREEYMISNFIDAYARCGEENVMGIYGSYHTDLSKTNLMGGQLKNRYGDKMSSVALYLLLVNKKPYKLGFCLTGLVFLLLLFIPNIYWGAKAKPEGYDAVSKKENPVLLIFERAGEVLVTATLLVFPSLNPHVLFTGGLYYDWKILIWIAAFVLMIFYELYWIRYFRSERTLRDMYSSFAGFPVAGASLPVIAVFLLGLSAGNLIAVLASIILGIGHIGIHIGHKKEAEE